MLKPEREQELMQLLRATGYLSVQELSQRLYTSQSTVRRILAALEAKGQIRRTYGGAEPQEHYSQADPFRTRTKSHTAAKREIAEKAAALVPDGSVVFLDQSSTAYYLAEALQEKKGLTVVTNNLEIAGRLSQTDFEVFVSGGHLSRQMRMCLVGEDAHRIFRDIHADFAFFSAFALSEDGIISDCNREEVCIRSTMLENAKCRVFLCDSSKFGCRSGYRQCTLSDVDVLISDGSSASPFALRCENLRVL